MSVTEFKIEKGIPYVEYQTARFKYPWLQMETGDSFVFATETDNKSFNRARMGAYKASVDGKKFRAQRTPTGVRVHRVA